MSDSQEQTLPTGQPVVAVISRELVRVHSRHFGRGPTKARTVWREDVIVCILEEIFLPWEETLVATGRFEQVRANRLSFQDAAEPLMIDAVESATGRPVRAFFSQVNPDGIACETFLLERPADPSPAGSDA